MKSYSVREIFGEERFLRAEMMPEATVIAMRIARVELVETDDDRFLEVTFHTRYPALRATPPLAQAIAHVLGCDDIRDWVGREVGIYRSVDHLPAGYAPNLRVCSAKQAKEK